jgi:hypothetical protein
VHRKLLFSLLSVLVLTCFVASGFSVPLEIGVDSYGTQYKMPERKTIYNNKTLIAYFKNNSGIQYRFSVDDGASWSTNYTHLASMVDSRFSVRTYNVSGVCYIYTAYVLSSGTNQVLFRRDIMYSATRIVAGTVYGVGNIGSVADYPDVEVGTDGSVYAACGFRSETGLAKRIYCQWFRSTNNDGSGTWIVWNARTRIGANYVSSSGGDNPANAVAVGLTQLSSGKIYCLYYCLAKSNLVNGTIWDGVGQWANESIITVETTTRYFSLAPYGTNVLWSYSNYSGGVWMPWFKYRNGTDGTWSVPERVSANQTMDSSNICVNATNGDAWFVWEGGNTSKNEMVLWAKRTWATKTYGNTGNLTKRYATDGMYDFTVQPLINQVHAKLMLTYVWFYSGVANHFMFVSQSLAAAAGPSVWTWRIGSLSRTIVSERFTIQKTFHETGISRTVQSKSFLMWFRWQPNALSFSLSSVSYQRLAFLFLPTGLAWVVGSERIVREMPFPQGYDSSSALGGLDLLMNYRYPESGTSEAFVSQAFVKRLVFRQTDLTETLGSLSWTKIISFITYTESMSSQALGSERWLMQFVFNRGDTSSFLSGSAWLLHFRYGESGVSETVSSREFVKNLIFRETGLSETLGSVAWNKVLEFFVFTEGTVSETVGSVSWVFGLGLDYRPLLILFSILACVVGVLLFYWYRDKE